jgi:mono/diheme cytochrome c family protein
VQVSAFAALAFLAAAAPGEIAAGRLVAERNCGGCHAVASGDSPLADAPPFRLLHRRYGPGGLESLLQRGMLADHPGRLEEGRRPSNPRMPAVVLEDDEFAHLAAYLRSLEPASGPAPSP